MNRTYLKNLTTVGLLTLTVAGCSSGGDSGSPTTTPPTVTLSISGTASSSATVSVQSVNGKMTKGIKFSQNLCAGAPWSMSYVGGGGSAIATGTADSNAEFSVPSVPKGNEGIITFSGASCTQRCLVKAGDAGIVCNPVADAVVGAFESALSKSITDATFADVKLAKIGAAIQQAAEGDSAAVSAFNADIATCAGLATDAKPACYKSAIEASPFAGQFKMLQAAANGWTVEAIYTFLTDSAGFTVSIDNFLYTDFGTKMDTWLGTDFVAATKAFIAAVVADQAAGGTNAYALKISCRGSYSKYHAGGEFSFDPVITNGVPSCKNSAALQANGLSAGQANTVIAAINADGHDAIQLGTTACSTPNGWNDANYFCMWPPEMLLISKFKEVNRNDPEGKNGSWEETQRIGLVNIFPEMNTVLQNLGSMSPPESDCATAGQNGPPTIKNTTACSNWFGNIMLENKKNFAGILGLYMYLKNPSAYTTGGSSKLSLDDIHKIFTGSSFLNAKLAAWAPMYNGVSVSYGQETRYLQPILAYNSSSDKFSLQDIFKYGASAPNSTQANAAIAASTLPYKYTFQMFEHIPDADEVRTFVFGSSHHEEWNPSGTKYFYTAGVLNTGKPVLCKMVNSETGKSMESELSTKTSIQCLSDYSGITNTNGALTGVSASYPYVLVNRGWMGDAEGSLYALADRKTGMPVRPGNSEIFVKEYRTTNASICKTVGEKNTIVTAIMKYGWGDDTREESMKSYCLDMSGFTNSSLYRFYDGGELEIKQKTSDGQVFTFRMRQVGVRSTAGSDTTTLAPLCAFTSNITKDQQTNLSTLTGGTLTSGAITSRGTSDLVFDLCSNNSSHASLTKYYLIMMGGSENSTRSSMKAFLMSSSGSAEFVQAVAWGMGTTFEDTILSVGPDVIEGAGAGLSSQAVAPTSAPVFTSNVKLLNTKYNAKFDPYCDDVNGNGYCDCYDGATFNSDTGTGTLKADPTQCSLLDYAAEPTMSNAPYCVQCDNSAKIAALFAAMGGKAGADLTTVPALTVGGATINSASFNGTYLQANSMWFNTDESFQCQYKKTGESFYRKPTFVRWENFSKNAEGCPAANGTITAITNWGQGNEVGGGPVRMVLPKPMNNAYDVAKPDTMMKLVNYATKSIGQNVTLASSEKVFSFDEALALMSLRHSMPVKITVYSSDGTTPAPGAHPMFQQVETVDKHSDAASAVLRGLTRPSELSQ